MSAAVKNCGAVLLGVALALGLSEILLRFHNPLGLRLKGEKIVLPANVKMRIANDGIPGLDKVIIHSKNSLGFRGEEPPEDPGAYFKIITVGGSTTECLYLSDGRTWPDILARELKSRCPRVWLNNAGLDGHSTFGHLILMDDYIVRLQPDMVLFLVGANDLGRRDLGEFDRAAMRGYGSWQAAANTLAAHSEVMNVLINLYRKLKARHVAHKHLQVRELEPIHLTEKKRRAALRSTRPLLRPYAQRVRSLLRISKKHGITPVLVTQPALFGCGTDPTSGRDLSDLEFGWGQNGCLSWEILEEYNGVLRRLAAEENVPAIDLARQLPHDSALFYDSFHFNNRGAQVVGETIFRALYPYVREHAGCGAD